MLFRVVGTDRSIGLFDLAARQPDQRIYIDSTSTVAGMAPRSYWRVTALSASRSTGNRMPQRVAVAAPSLASSSMSDC